jgi:predicted MFS family arabinose efflux permease
VSYFWALLFAYFLSQFYRAFLAVVAGDLSRDLGLGPAELGMASAVWFVAFALTQFPVGLWLDRHGPRRAVAGLMLLGSAGAFLFAMAKGYAAILAAMALIGIGCSPILMGALYLFARLESPARFAGLASLFIGLGNIGNLAAATPLALAVESFGWRGSMAAIAVAMAGGAIIAYAFVRDPAPTAATAGDDSLLGGLAAVLRLRALWPILPLTFVSYAVVAAERALWIAPFLGDVHGLDTIARGNGALLMAAAMAIGGMAYGPIERLFGAAKPTVLAANLGVVVLFGLLAAIGERSTALAILLLAGIGFVGLNYGVLMAHARLFFPPHLVGRGVTFMNFMFIAGAGVVQSLSGRLVAGTSAAGFEKAATYGLLHAAFAIGLALATAIYVVAPPRPVRQA